MVFSGVMAKGKINPHFESVVRRLPEGEELLSSISSKNEHQFGLECLNFEREF
jgi:hypothetical protein